jgi:hypothetical protein
MALVVVTRGPFLALTRIRVLQRLECHLCMFFRINKYLLTETAA